MCVCVCGSVSENIRYFLDGIGSEGSVFYNCVCLLVNIDLCVYLDVDMCVRVCVCECVPAAKGKQTIPIEHN